MHEPQVRLTEEERRRLEELEAAFRMEDPRLDRRLKSARRIPLAGVVLAAAPPARGAIGLAMVAIGAILCIATLTLWLPLAIAGAVLMALGGYLTTTAASTCDLLRRLNARLRRGSASAAEPR